MIKLVFFQIILSAFLLFLGIYGIISTYKLDKKTQKKLIDNPETVILSSIPLWLTKFILYLLCLIPIVITIAMWLQKFGVIE